MFMKANIRTRRIGLLKFILFLYRMDNSRMEIDLVYLWVDGSDPNWQAKKRRFTGDLSDHSETNNKGRYISNDELRYALRSAEKHAPWRSEEHTSELQSLMRISSAVF